MVQLNVINLIEFKTTLPVIITYFFVFHFIIKRFWSILREPRSSLKAKTIKVQVNYLCILKGYFLLGIYYDIVRLDEKST